MKKIKKNPKQMVRKIMKLILGEEVLKRSSPTGKNGWTPIPDNVFTGVECKICFCLCTFTNCQIIKTIFISVYVKANVSKKKYQLPHKVYRETLTAYCATQRNPRSKDSTKNTARDQSSIVPLRQEL